MNIIYVYKETEKGWRNDGVTFALPSRRDEPPIFLEIQCEMRVWLVPLRGLLGSLNYPCLYVYLWLTLNDQFVERSLTTSQWIARTLVRASKCFQLILYTESVATSRMKLEMAWLLANGNIHEGLLHLVNCWIRIRKSSRHRIVMVLIRDPHPPLVWRPNNA